MSFPVHRPLRCLARRFARRLALVLLGAAALGGIGTAHAIDYVVEVVVFENLGRDAGAGGDELWFPKTEPALALGDERAAAAGFDVVESGLTLLDSRERMESSGAYRVLRHFAWRQPGLDDAAAQAIRVTLGERIDMYVPDDVSAYEEFVPASAAPRPDRARAVTSTTVNGTLKVRLGRFLHMDALLVFTDTARGRSFRLSESRKMRSRELHYLDNPRFGLLTRIVPVEATAPVEAPVEAPGGSSGGSSGGS